MNLQKSQGKDPADLVGVSAPSPLRTSHGANIVVLFKHDVVHYVISLLEHILGRFIKFLSHDYLHDDFNVVILVVLVHTLSAEELAAYIPEALVM